MKGPTLLNSFVDLKTSTGEANDRYAALHQMTTQICNIHFNAFTLNVSLPHSHFMDVTKHSPFGGAFRDIQNLDFFFSLSLLPSSFAFLFFFAGYLVGFNLVGKTWKSF